MRRTMKVVDIVIAVLAAGMIFFSCPGFSGEAIELVVGQQRVIEVDFPQRIAIGNGAIADVFLTSNKKQVLVTAKGVGVTDLIIWDKGGNKGIRRIIVWEKDPKSIAQELEQLLREIEGIKVNVVGPNIVLEGELFKQVDLQRFNNVIKSYPDVINLVRINPRLKQMIEIDVKIAEVDEEVSRDFNPIPLQASYGIRSDPSPSPFYTVGVDFSQLNIWIKEGKARLLAKPRLVVVSGEEATFVAGGEIPYSVSQGDRGITTEWKKYGVTLKIKPAIDSQGNIELFLYAEASGPDRLNMVGGIPGILTRWTQTNLFLQRGETVIIAGLLQKNVSKSTRRVPVLGYIPILNWFFSGSQSQIKETELLIFVTPKIPAGINPSEYKKVGIVDDAAGRDSQTNNTGN
ncbi:hypothetical protein COS91_05635 [Candidatus Desantisbacteria bacterium CG07_land_8_20_14_0_80_39_15]|uniref:Uncharacterized protein n=1 Tax=Candidatus Desantisbacteria bacterium CG07_land_8_20_14_0_80_39_15 TaxID=1974549 RepID=A0A2M6ZFQ0_9BACT|nr:MAG: hypothetical protein COS91_05635 [Candidatus Desantisbacteria bacterium CG07_land_8_20_14_0_80_39_15]